MLAEMKLQASPIIDPASVVKAGKLLGARFLVLGRFFYTLDTFRVDARIVDMETGQILASVGATGIPDHFIAVEQKLVDGLEDHFTKIVPPPTKASTGRAPRTRATRPPARLKAKTAAEYGRALEAIDRNDKQGAKRILEKVVADAPDFSLATTDLDRLMK